MPATKKTPASPQESTPEVATAPKLDLTALDKIEEYVSTDLESIPEKVRDVVEHAYAAWKEQPNKWRIVELASEDAVKELLRLARKYADAREPAPLTVRTKNIGEPTKLVFRITDRQTRTATPADATASAEK